jgi:hypothetical protein
MFKIRFVLDKQDLLAQLFKVEYSFCSLFLLVDKRNLELTIWV